MKWKFYTCSQKKEAAGSDEELPEGLETNLANITADQLKPLTINQIKKIRLLMDKAVEENIKKLAETEKERNDALRELGNHLHSSCVVSNNEVIS